jgi:hypothetical protein
LLIEVIEFLEIDFHGTVLFKIDLLFIDILPLSFILTLKIIELGNQFAMIIQDRLVLVIEGFKLLFQLSDVLQVHAKVLILLVPLFILPCAHVR